MWSYYFKTPDFETKTEIQLAQISSILVNVNGGKTTTNDFMLNFEKEKEPKKSIEQRVAESANRLAQDVKKI